MPFPALSDIHKTRIQQHIVNNLPIASIAFVENVKKSIVYRIIDNILAFGHHTAPLIGKKGRLLTIYSVVKVELRSFIESKSWAYLNEMQYDLFDRFDLVVYTSTICRTLRSMKINRKSLRRIVSERSQICRDSYFLIINSFAHD